jgi:hypothetical protein
MEVRQSLALAVEKATFDLVDEYVPAPAVLNGLANVPFPCGAILDRL